jgi:hypothetical protein
MAAPATVGGAEFPVAEPSGYVYRSLNQSHKDFDGPC